MIDIVEELKNLADALDAKAAGAKKSSETRGMMRAAQASYMTKADAHQEDALEVRELIARLEG